jgi:hypothetical protein
VWGIRTGKFVEMGFRSRMQNRLYATKRLAISILKRALDEFYLFAYEKIPRIRENENLQICE